MPVLAGFAAAKAGKADETEMMLERCEAWSRKGVFRIASPESAALPRIMHLHFTGGDLAPQQSKVWLFETRCPRMLSVTKEDGARLDLVPAAGTRGSWHGGSISLFAREAQEQALSASDRPQAFFSHSLVGNWQGRRARRTYADMRSGRPGCAESVLLTVFDRDPTLPLDRSYYAYDLRIGECQPDSDGDGGRASRRFSRGPRERLTGPSGLGPLRQGPGADSMLHAAAEKQRRLMVARESTQLRTRERRWSAASEPGRSSCPPTLAHRDCDTSYKVVEEVLMARGARALELLQVALPDAARLVWFEPSGLYSNRTVEVEVGGRQAVLIAPSRARFIALHVTGNTSGLHVYALTTERERVTSLEQIALRVDVPCAYGSRQRVLYRRPGQLPFEQVGERCVQHELEWLDHRTDAPWSPGAKAFGIRSYQDDALPYMATLVYNSMSADMHVTARAYPEAMVCPATYIGADKSFGIRAADKVRDALEQDKAEQAEGHGDGGAQARPGGTDGEAGASAAALATAHECYGPCPTAPAFTPVPLAAASCAPCPAGSFLETYRDPVTKEQAHPPACLPCQQPRAPGSFPVSTKPSLYGAHSPSDCREVCGQGYFSTDGLGPCEECAQGKYSDTSYATACTNCPAGMSTKRAASQGLGACFSADIGVERVFLSGKKVMVTVYWSITPATV